MVKIVVLFLATSGDIQGVFWGESALRNCVALGQTYEVDVTCAEVASEDRPHMGLQDLDSSPRPRS